MDVLECKKNVGESSSQGKENEIKAWINENGGRM